MLKTKTEIKTVIKYSFKISHLHRNLLFDLLVFALIMPQKTQLNQNKKI